MGFMYTCRAEADEMTGVPFRTNTLMFKSGEIEDNTSFYGLHSRAGRLKNVLDADMKTRQRMLL
jgi:hypothetical protein